MSIFFYNVLHPPHPPSSYSTKIEKYYDLGDVKVGAGVEEVAPGHIFLGLFLLLSTCRFYAKSCKINVCVHAYCGTFILLFDLYSYQNFKMIWFRYVVCVYLCVQICVYIHTSVLSIVVLKTWCVFADLCICT